MAQAMPVLDRVDAHLFRGRGVAVEQKIALADLIHEDVVERLQLLRRVRLGVRELHIGRRNLLGVGLFRSRNRKREHARAGARGKQRK